MTQISILGCGWLGLPLARALLQNGFSVNGSTTSSEKLSVLENSGIQPFQITLDSNRISGNIEAFLRGSKILIIDIPPKLRGNSKDPLNALGLSFVGKIETLIPFIEKSEIENVIFVSSTSVYGDANSIIAEETEPHPETEGGKQLLQTEQLLQKNTNFKTTVLRFGGLIGEDRHPVHFLAGRTNIENPNAPINLIHQEDCMGIIMKIIEINSWGETFNGVAPFHPNRKEYYTQKAAELNLALPEFNYQLPTFGKIVLSSKVEKVLGYSFSKKNL
jgi:nucleoside-diphosphate-sugar epimerase